MGSAPALAAPSASGFRYDAIGHGHLDMAWLWPVRETRRKAARTYVRALNAVESREDYRYGTSQPQQMAWTRDRHPELFARLRALNAIAADRGQSLAQLALSWVLRDRRITSALIGASSVEQLAGNLAAVSAPPLTDEELAAIDEHATDLGINIWAGSSAV